MVIAVGDSYRTIRHLYHVRAIVDDDQVVVRHWSYKYGGMWVYQVELMDVLEILLNEETYEHRRVKRKATQPAPTP